jgi:hypothetical protein
LPKRIALPSDGNIRAKALRGLGLLIHRFNQQPFYNPTLLPSLEPDL